MGKWMKASEMAGIPPMTVVRTGVHCYVTEGWTGEHEDAIMLSGGGHMLRSAAVCWIHFHTIVCLSFRQRESL